MTYENLFVSIVVALITAFVTALLNNAYWGKQFKEQEKSEYRKLYHRRKLEVYEKLAEYIAIKYNDMYFIVWLTTRHTYTKDNMPHWALHKMRAITEGADELKSKHIMYISLAVWKKLQELNKFVMDVYDNILNGKKSEDNMTKQFADIIVKIQGQLRNELSIRELLETIPLSGETLKKMKQDVAERGQDG